MNEKDKECTITINYANEAVLAGMKKKIELYADMFPQFEKEVSRGQVFPELLEKILDSFSQVCSGEVVYSVHVIEDNYIKFILGGPLGFLDRRGSTDSVSHDKGYIGKTLKTNSLYCIFDKVDVNDGYIEANNETKSELVIRIPNFTNNKSIGVINLESNIESAFDNIDGIVFSIIASWQAAMLLNDSSIDEKNNLLLSFTDLFNVIRKNPSQYKKINKEYSNIVKKFIPYDAINMVSVLPFYEVMDISGTAMELDYSHGYLNNGVISSNYCNDRNTFAYNVLCSGKILYEKVEESDRFNINNYRSKSKYAIGSCYPSNNSSEKIDGAIVLEFNEPRESIDRDKVSLDILSKLYSETKAISLQSKECTNFRRAVQLLPKLDKSHISPDLTAIDFLAQISAHLSRSMKSDACIFFEIVPNNEGGRALITLAHHIKYDTKSNNVFWEKAINKQWGNISHAIKAGNDFDKTLKVKLPNLESDTNYSIFAKKINAKLNKNILFVSLLKIPNNKIVKMSYVTKNILNVQLNLVSSTLEKSQYARSSDSFKSGMSIAIELLFKETLAFYKNNSLEQTEEHIFERVHLLLEKWIGVIATPYTSIYKYKEINEDKELVMTESTYKYLKNKSGPNLHKFPSKPLVFDVDPKSEMSSIGLTRKTWSGDERSLVSINVGEQGSSDCKAWWNNAVGIIDRGRYFAGAKIFNKDKTKPYGVITINGNKPSYFIARQLEADWEILPLLETLSDELGKQLEILYEKYDK